MGLFTRRRRAAIPDDWQAADQRILVCRGVEMDDDGCASDHAYGAHFWLESAAAWLTIWAYPAPAGAYADDGYFIGYRVDYRTDDDAWAVALYYGDITWAEWYDNLADAEQAAHDSAASLLRSGRDADTLHVSAETIAGWFDWDGVPW